MLQQLAAGSADASMKAAAEATRKQEATQRELDSERATARTLQAHLRQADDLLEKSEAEQAGPALVDCCLPVQLLCDAEQRAQAPSVCLAGRQCLQTSVYLSCSCCMPSPACNSRLVTAPKLLDSRHQVAPGTAEEAAGRAG